MAFLAPSSRIASASPGSVRQRDSGIVPTSSVYALNVVTRAAVSFRVSSLRQCWTRVDGLAGPTVWPCRWSFSVIKKRPRSVVMAAWWRELIWSGSFSLMTGTETWWPGCGEITTGSGCVFTWVVYSLGLCIQLSAVRCLGRFLAVPLDGVPAEAIDFLAGQLGIVDPSCVKQCALRPQTHREYAAKIRNALGLMDFAQVEGELAVFVGRRSWVSGDGPKRSLRIRWGGRGSGMCCCRGCLDWRGWWHGNAMRRHSGCGRRCMRR